MYRRRPTDVSAPALKTMVKAIKNSNGEGYEGITAPAEVRPHGIARAERQIAAVLGGVIYV
ncbi:hypothetical protein P3T20_004023 [Paraburkholderia sp. GAS206C]